MHLQAYDPSVLVHMALGLQSFFSLLEHSSTSALLSENRNKKNTASEGNTLLKRNNINDERKKVDIANSVSGPRKWSVTAVNVVCVQIEIR